MKSKIKVKFPSNIQSPINDTTEPEPIENEKKHLSPLIKWSGGKGDEISQFINYFPNDIDTYIEPFIGGGAVYFYLNHKKNVINDVHKELVDFYKTIKEGNIKEIYNFMDSHPNDEITYYQVRDKMDYSEPIENAKRFYYLRKTCFRGMLRYNKDGKFNIPYGKYKSINYTELLNDDITKLLKNTEIHNKDFSEIFYIYNNPKNFMFLDPPYDSKFTDYGYCQFGEVHHRKLAKCFKETKIRCLMVIGKTKLIEELYGDYIVGEYEKKYRFKIHSGRVGSEIDTKHVIIKNF